MQSNPQAQGSSIISHRSENVPSVDLETPHMDRVSDLDLMVIKRFAEDVELILRAYSKGELVPGDYRPSLRRRPLQYTIPELCAAKRLSLHPLLSWTWDISQRGHIMMLTRHRPYSRGFLITTIATTFMRRLTTQDHPGELSFTQILSYRSSSRAPSVFRAMVVLFKSNSDFSIDPQNTRTRRTLMMASSVLDLCSTVQMTFLTSVLLRPKPLLFTSRQVKLFLY